VLPFEIEHLKKFFIDKNIPKNYKIFIAKPEA